MRDEALDIYFSLFPLSLENGFWDLHFGKPAWLLLHWLLGSIIP